MLLVRSLVSKIVKPQKKKLPRQYFIMQMHTNPKTHIVWMDMEMTDLDVHTGKILEVSCLLTDKNLNVLAEGPDLIIHQPEDILNSMSDWSTQHHAQSGLTEQSRQSNITEEDAENQILEFLQVYIPRRTCPLAGNTIYMDRLFLREYMPRVDEYLHHRIIDVSTIKELCKRWHPSIFFSAPKKKLTHRSLDDIKESIQELIYYKENLFGIRENN